MRNYKKRILSLIVILGLSIFLFPGCPNATGDDTAADKDPPEAGNVTVTLTNAPANTPVDEFYAVLYAENEPAINTESKVLALHSSAVANGTATFILEGEDTTTADNWAANGTVWSGSGGMNYDLYIYTDNNSDEDWEPVTTPTAKRCNPFPMTVTIDGNQAVTIDYADMVDYSGGTVTITISGAGDHDGQRLLAAVFMNGVVLSEDPEGMALAHNDGLIGSGNATVRVQYPMGGDFYGIDGMTYDIYAFIDLDGSGDPSSGDFVYGGMTPHTYTQSGDKTLPTIFADDYTIMP